MHVATPDPIEEALAVATAERDRLSAQLTSAKRAEQEAIDDAANRNTALVATRAAHVAELEATRVRLQPLEFQRKSELDARLKIRGGLQELTRGLLGTAAFVGWLMALTRGDYAGGTMLALLGAEAVAVWWLGDKANHEEQNL
jgi:hypothetical protein